MSLVFDSQNKSSLISISRFRFFVEVGKSSSSKELMSPIFLLTSRSCFLLQLKNRFLLEFLIARISFCASIPIVVQCLYEPFHFTMRYILWTLKLKKQRDFQTVWLNGWRSICCTKHFTINLPLFFFENKKQQGREIYLNMWPTVTTLAPDLIWVA